MQKKEEEWGTREEREKRTPCMAFVRSLEICVSQLQGAPYAYLLGMSLLRFSLGQLSGKTWKSFSHWIDIAVWQCSTHLLPNVFELLTNVQVITDSSGDGRLGEVILRK